MKQFNVADWLPTEIAMKSSANNNLQIRPSIETVENLLLLIEERQIDLTATYQQWRDIGFGLVDEFKEDGRAFYHRVSQFYPGYTHEECEKQYQRCLESKGNGITVATLFHLATSEGLKCEQLSTDRSCETPLPCFPELPELPDFLKKIILHAETDEQRDILLLGSLVVISSCLNNLSGQYNGKTYWSNLYLFVVGKAGFGKGILEFCRQLVQPIHNEKVENYNDLLKDYHQKRKMEELDESEDEKPKRQTLFLPANSTSAAMFQLLSNNDGSGLIFETEGDTLAQAFKSDQGNFSDGLRKAFHHEPISSYRKTHDEYIDIERPCMSAVLSGTPMQISNLIPSSENGLLSRFMFYFLNSTPEWKDVWINSDYDLQDHFSELAYSFKSLHEKLKQHDGIQFIFSNDQRNRFNIFFYTLYNTYGKLQGENFSATSFRLGLITFRLAMVISILRYIDKNLPYKIVCEETDFQTALEMITVLTSHSSFAFDSLSKKKRTKKNKDRFLESLPKHFNRTEYIETAAMLSIVPKTAEGYITEFVKNGLINRGKQGSYIKIEETKDIQD